MKGQSINVPSSRLLVFIDETGSESLTDPNHPIFGLAGCTMPAHVYFGFVRKDWRALKFERLGDQEAPLHAASIDPADKILVQAIAEFFLSQHFSRFGVTISDATERDGMETYELVSMALLQQFLNVARYWSGFDGIVFIMERSQRGEPLARKFLTDWSYKSESNGQQTEIPIQRHFMPKSANEPGLEIADFIAQALGASSRGFRMNGRPPTDRRDFQAIVSEVRPRRLVSFIDIKSVEADQAAVERK